MKEPKPFEIHFGDEPKELLPDNCHIVLFRKEPDKDYIHYWESIDEERDAHWFSFENRPFLLWAGHIALKDVDVETIAELDRENGSFEKHFNWRPDVYVRDRPKPYEQEFYEFHIEAISEHIDDEWSAFDDE